MLLQGRLSNVHQIYLLKFLSVFFVFLFSSAFGKHDEILRGGGSSKHHHPVADELVGTEDIDMDSVIVNTNLSDGDIPNYDSAIEFYESDEAEGIERSTRILQSKELGEKDCLLQGGNKVWQSSGDSGGSCYGRCGYGDQSTSDDDTVGGPVRGKGPCGNDRRCCHRDPIDMADGSIGCLCWISLVKQVEVIVEVKPVEIHDKDAEEARWLVQSAQWGTLSTKLDDDFIAEIVFFGQTNGRLFFYLMNKITSDGSLTLSEASLHPEQFAGARCGDDADSDPEDPRCAKVTITGKLSPCMNDESCQIGKDALSYHPVENCQGDQSYVVHEFDITELWMISNYGGGGAIDASTYYSSIPIHHGAGGYSSKGDNLEKPKVNDALIPYALDTVARSRWLVFNSLWMTISTSSVHLDGKPWGNIRSVVDGKSLELSKGLPMFYLPTPDPTTIDITYDNRIILTFSEAALAKRVDSDGNACGGQRAESPTCANIHLSGTAVPLDDTEITIAKGAFRERHPLASWLAEGGGHTGGGYFTIDIDNISFSGLTSLSVEEYLAWSTDDPIPPTPINVSTVETSCSPSSQPFVNKTETPNKSRTALVAVSIAFTLFLLVAVTFSIHRNNISKKIKNKDTHSTKVLKGTIV